MNGEWSVREDKQQVVSEAGEQPQGIHLDLGSLTFTRFTQFVK